MKENLTKNFAVEISDALGTIGPETSRNTYSAQRANGNKSTTREQVSTPLERRGNVSD